jgi:hypothetical protein
VPRRKPWHQSPVLSCPSLSSYPAGKRATGTWGYSSAARAVALQAIGLGFKSPYLQRTWSLTMQGKGEEERALSRWAREAVRGARGETPASAAAVDAGL